MKTPKTFGERLRKARNDAGMTLADAVFAVRQLLPEPMWISQAALQRLETGKIDEDVADPYEVGVLAAVYDVPMSDLSPVALERFKMLADLVERQLRCSSRRTTTVQPTT